MLLGNAAELFRCLPARTVLFPSTPAPPGLCCFASAMTWICSAPRPMHSHCPFLGTLLHVVIAIFLVFPLRTLVPSLLDPERVSPSILLYLRVRRSPPGRYAVASIPPGSFLALSLAVWTLCVKKYPTNLTVAPG